MTITISLPTETEAKLRQRAAACGQTVEAYVRQLVEREVGSANGGPAHQDPSLRVAASRPLPSDEALAPFRREVAESGISDEELRTFFEEVREEVYRVKDGPSSDASGLLRSSFSTADPE
jgi:plasmid stability protein